MRVLLSSFVPWWNAEAAYAAALAEELLRAGHQAWLAVQPDTPNAEQLARRGLPLITDIPPAGRNPLEWGRCVAALRALQLRESIEIVDVFRSEEFALHGLAARSAPAARLVRTRGTARPVRGGWFNQKMYGEWCHALVASSEAVRMEMCQVLKLAPEAIRVIYFPAEDGPPPSPGQRREARHRLLAELGVEGERTLVGMVGRIAQGKGFERLLAAMGPVAAKVPDALALLFARGAAEGGEGDPGALARAIETLGLQNHVRLVGLRQDVPELMAALDVGVIPSLTSEMNCRVAMEFFAAGTPVVAFPTGALPEVVEDGQSGLVTGSHDPAELAQAIVQLATDRELRARLGAGGRAQAETRFSRGRFLAETLEVFQAALAK